MIGLAARGIRKSLGRRTAPTGVDMHVAPGEMIAVAGQNESRVMRWVAGAVCALGAAVVCLAASPASAAAGDLDGTFGTGGKVTTDFAGNGDEARAVALQPDGKIVAAGGALGATVDFALARYGPDGTLDTTFGADGKVATDFGSGEQA